MAQFWKKKSKNIMNFNDSILKSNPPFKIFDSHAHLADKAFSGIREEVLERARTGGIAGVICPGDSLETSRAVIQLVGENPDFLYAAVGLHPYEAKNYNDDAEGELASLSGKKGCVAIGEIGLDFRKDGTDPSPHEAQREAFLRQAALCGNLNLPAIVHCRNAYPELIELFSKEEYKGMRGVVHCFSGTRDEAIALIALGWHIGFTGTLSFKNATGLREAAASIPLEKILIETDAPYLTPHPYRGRFPNEPCYARLVAEALSSCRGIPLEEVCKTTYNNTNRLFKIKSTL
jgi:TatD DNase family protein